MSTAPHTRPATGRCACLRVLVLLLALLVPGMHAEAHAVPVVVVACESGGTAAEQDVLDAVLRPPVRDTAGAVTALRPAPLSDRPQARAADHPPVPAPPTAPYRRLLALCCVVLRC
ncbi:hypothetical protein [Streptomyces sp. NPDC046197]|uniref:hypothetical protein n=1 Tax=Streptomyces sp. NPDC046197 TaxID=3154337 RepID=UPI0033CB3652